MQSPYKDVQGSSQSPGCLSPTPVFLGTWLSPGWEHSSGPHMDGLSVLSLSCIPSPAPALLIVWVREMGPERNSEIKRTSKPILQTLEATPPWGGLI